LIAKSLGSASWFLVATPAYLKRRGRPRSPDDLKKHDCLLLALASTELQCASKTADSSVQLAVSRA